MATRRLIELPLGTRFRYQGAPGTTDVFVLLERHGCGLVALWRGPDAAPAVIQGIYSAADSEEAFPRLEVIVVG